MPPGGVHTIRALAPAAYASQAALPPPAQGSLPAGWLAFAGRGSNPLDRYVRFQSALTSSSFPGLILSQVGPIHAQADELGAAPLVGALLGQELARARLCAPGGLIGVR